MILMRTLRNDYARYANEEVRAVAAQWDAI